MTLSITDYDMIKAESKLLGLKLDAIDSRLTDVVNQQNEIIKLLEKLVDNTHRPVLGRDYQVFSSGDD